MKKKLKILILLLTLFSVSNCNIADEEMMTTKPEEIRYAVIGDSYSIGEGASEAESWPKLLTNHLKGEGIDIKLVANPSVTGWTTQDAINRELSIFKNAKPTFATLLIGVNDYVQRVNEDTFRANLRLIIDEMQKEVDQHLVIVTIPDFSQVPAARYFGDTKNIVKGLGRFNEIITEEARARNVQIVDIFPLSQDLNQLPGMVADDGLHPSAKAYAEWEKIIFPVVKKKLEE